MYGHSEAKAGHQMSSPLTLIYCSETGSLMGLEACLLGYAGWSVISQDPPVSTLMLALQAHAAMPRFLPDALDLNSDPCVC